MTALVRAWGHIIRDPRRIVKQLAVFVFVSILLLFAFNKGWPAQSLSIGVLSDDELRNMTQTAQFFIDNPIKPPYRDQFWEAGQRSKHVGKWLWTADKLDPKSRASRELYATTENVAQQLYPFLQNPPRNPGSKTPLADLRKSYEKDSEGIIIPVGGGEQSVRFASHLIVSLQRVLDCYLPIQIVYAGDEDLPKKDRDRILALEGIRDVEFLDVFTVFDDTSLKLKDGGWAIKVFALLASKFEKAILLDADAVFLQNPYKLFTQQPYMDKGAYLFHDRLLWQHSFRERHDWWKDQIKEPSAEMNKSRVWMEDYAEECDSGVVVVDKSRVPVLAGLLHVAWQNTYHVREEATYRLGHGDKESWWLGLELAGSSYEFEAHYGSMIGWGDAPVAENVTQVCSFVIAHLDTRDRLLWYNGSLLKNKKVDPEGYQVPNYWMTDGKWHKGRTKKDMSCMAESKVNKLTKEETRILSRSIEEAKKVDKALNKDRSRV
ncbi:hypothetical protein F66182_1514 [Fusarium sp. NRRL 66182]|nr:hypothetical protein F66182_1514 [Fusarium sp. NRRL 66182]